MTADFTEIRLLPGESYPASAFLGYVTEGTAEIRSDTASFSVSPDYLTVLFDASVHALSPFSMIICPLLSPMPAVCSAVRTEPDSGILSLFTAGLAISESRPPLGQAILQHVAEAVSLLLPGLDKVPVRSPHTEQLMQLLEAHYAEADFEISSAIDTLPFCRDHMRRLFKSETGMSPIAYLSRLRLDAACRLLQRQSVSHQSITEVAYTCGFNDVRYFARQFKKHTGVSPSEYAEQFSA